VGSSLTTTAKDVAEERMEWFMVFILVLDVLFLSAISANWLSS
jgi:hypothetical protein